MNGFTEQRTQGRPGRTITGRLLRQPCRLDGSIIGSDWAKTARKRAGVHGAKASKRFRREHRSIGVARLT